LSCAVDCHPPHLCIGRSEEFDEAQYHHIQNLIHGRGLANSIDVIFTKQLERQKGSLSAVLLV
jgi:hypothetical protein